MSKLNLLVQEASDFFNDLVCLKLSYNWLQVRMIPINNL